MNRILILCVLVLASNFIYAQSDCLENLFNANRLYNEGKLNEAISLAQPCSKSAEVSEQWKAERIIALCNLALGNKKEASKSAEKILELNPTFKPSSSNNPVEFIKLINSVKVIPKLSIGLTTIAGYSITTPQVINSHNGAAYKKEYSNRGSWQFGFTAGYNFNENLSIHSGVIAHNKQYDIGYAFGDRYDTTNALLDEKQYNVEVRERMTYINIPLYLRYGAQVAKNTQAFVNLGGYGGLLLDANSDFILTKLAVDESRKEFSSERLSSIDRKNRGEFGLLAGIGLTQKLKNTSVSLELNYMKGLGYNLTNAEQRYDNQELFINYFYWDDDLRLDNLAISINWIFNINYKVIKEND